MADFTIALALLLTDEGGYSNTAADSGGETVYGISRHYNPMWLGWQFVDAHKARTTNLKELNAALDADINLQAAVAAFYRQQFWNFDAVSSQAVANKLFSMEVNFGRGGAVRILQQGLVRLGHNIALDGSLGPSTYTAITNTNEPDLLHMLRAYAALHRVQVIQAHPDQIQFAEGWLIRDTA
jgi:lysozyme family protein